MSAKFQVDHVHMTEYADTMGDESNEAEEGAHNGNVGTDHAEEKVDKKIVESTASEKEILQHRTDIINIGERMHQKSKQSVAAGKAEFAAAFALSAQVRSDGSSHRVVSAEEQSEQNLKIDISSAKAASAPNFVHTNSGGNGSNSEAGGFERHLGYNYTGDGARRSTIPTKKVDQAWALMSEHSNAAERTQCDENHIF